LLGFLVAVYPIMQFFATPILGQLSDRYGRKPVLALSLFGTSLGYVLFLLGIVFRNIPILFVARALDGITGGNLSVAQAAICRCHTTE
jgi:MFS family permease